MRKTKLSLAVIIIVAVSFLSAGCWSRREIEDLGIISAVALDQAPGNKIQLSLLILNPTAYAAGQGNGGGGGGEEVGFVVSAVGSTIAEATRNIATTLPREIFWSHNRLVLIGGDYAKSGLKDLDFLSRERGTRLTSWVMVTPGRAVDLLKVKTTLEKTAAETLAELNRSRVALQVKLFQLLAALSTKGVSPVAPRVEKTMSQEAGAQGQEILKMTGTAIFKNNKLAGWADLEATRGLLWMRGEMVKGGITVGNPQNPGSFVSLRIRDAQRHVNSVVRDGELMIKVKVITDMDIEEIQQTSQLGNPGYIKLIEQAAEAKIAQRCSRALALAKKLKVDPFSFGAVIRSQAPNYWLQVRDDWDAVFADIPVKIQVEANVRRTGLTGNTVKQKD
ncbi:MAG: Ger(x)C family spore germination protein [Thermoanaerobacteraceae bacterium]|nr:Ger(x)C family spore germination protein [Thermoanaerobacteraceae bacterium]